jgi:hypothetical protein
MGFEAPCTKTLQKIVLSNNYLPVQKKQTMSVKRLAGNVRDILALFHIESLPFFLALACL